jgi:hypothetical protein
MSPLFLPLLFISAMTCGSILLSLFTLLHARTLARSGSLNREARNHAEELLVNLQARLDSLAAEVEECKNQPIAMAGLPKPGFNLSKRTQALRMHRRGDSPEQIATVLEVPRQEVNLLLKVQQIVISQI